MRLESTLTNKSNQTLKIIYNDGDPSVDLEGKILQGIHAFCFYNGKMVLVHHAKGGWVPPGGHIEPGETYEQTVVREVHEETNMKVLKQIIIGYQDIYEPNRIVRQTRSFCLVEPYGEFEKDPDGEISKIKLIDPIDYKNYFNWGEIGDYIIKQAIELSEKNI